MHLKVRWMRCMRAQRRPVDGRNANPLCIVILFWVFVEECGSFVLIPHLLKAPTVGWQRGARGNFMKLDNTLHHIASKISR